MIVKRVVDQPNGSSVHLLVRKGLDWYGWAINAGLPSVASFASEDEAEFSVAELKQIVVFLETGEIKIG